MFWKTKKRKTVGDHNFLKEGYFAETIVVNWAKVIMHSSYLVSTL